MSTSIATPNAGVCPAIWLPMPLGRNDSDGCHHTAGGRADAVSAFRPNPGAADRRTPGSR